MLCDQDPRVRTVRNTTGRTPDGLNAAIATSTGDVVIRFDGHGMPPPTYVSTAVGDLVATGGRYPGGYALLVLLAAALTPRGLPPRPWLWQPVVYATMHQTWAADFVTSPRALACTSPRTAPDTSGG